GSDSSESSGDALEDALSLRDEAAPARVLRALNALRKSRQHYDAVLLAGGAELPVHRAVLAAASPYLLQALAALPAPGAAPPACRVADVDADALAALVDYVYTGRLRVRDAGAARRLYRAAWRLRLEPVRAHLAAALLRRLSPADCLELRALPDLADDHVATLDAYIAQNFDEVCKSGALATLPLIRIELLRETSAEGGEETAFAVADAALVWLRDRQAVDADSPNPFYSYLWEVTSGVALCSWTSCAPARTCCTWIATARCATAASCPPRAATRPSCRSTGARPPSGAASRAASRAAPPTPRRPPPRCSWAGAPRARPPPCWPPRACPAPAPRALLALRGRLAGARVAWRDVPGGGGVARGGPLGGARDDGGGARAWARARGAGRGRAGARLLVLGGYDRARVLRSAEAYDAAQNEWSALPDMRGPRARFPAAVLGGTLYALGGSDGHAELDSVAALSEGRWAGRARLPGPVSHAGAAAVPERRELYVVGGWAAGVNLKRVLRYDPDADAWEDAPPLNAGEFLSLSLSVAGSRS
ncbi:hypothetical protein HF086_005928, partial [Spodoptera exigua]